MPSFPKRAAEQRAVRLVERERLRLRIPLVDELLPELLEVLAREADRAREAAATGDLARRKPVRQRPRAVVEACPIAAAAAVAEPHRPGGQAVPAAAGRDLERRGVRQLQRHDLDQAARELRRLVGRVGLADLDAVDETGREEVERHHAAVRLRGRQRRAGQRRVAVALAEPANEDGLPLDDGDAGHALHRVGGVRVVVRRHLHGADVVLHARRPHPHQELRGGGRRRSIERRRRHRQLLREHVRGEGHLDGAQLVLDDVHGHALLGVARHDDSQLVSPRRELEAKPAIEVRVGDLRGPDHLDRDPGQRDREVLVDDLTGNDARALGQSRRRERHRDPQRHHGQYRPAHPYPSSLGCGAPYRRGVSGP